MHRQPFAAKPYYRILLALIRSICHENHVDNTHGFAHAVKIGRLTEQALNSEPEVQDNSSDEQCIILAGYLHDLDDRKYFKTQGYANALKVLSSIQIPPEKAQKIIKMIDLVSFSKNGNNIDSDTSILYYLPRYIDRVEAIGIEGLYRSYEYNQHKMAQTPMFLESTSKPASTEEAFLISEGRDLEYMKSGISQSVVDHFFDKLIHIKLPKEITNKFLIELYAMKLKQMTEFIIQNAKDNYVNYQKNLIQWHASSQYQREGISE